MQVPSQKQLKAYNRKEMQNIPLKTFSNVITTAAVMMLTVSGRRGGYIDYVILKVKAG